VSVGHSYYAQFGEFVTSYTIKTAIWLRGLGLALP